MRIKIMHVTHLAKLPVTIVLSLITLPLTIFVHPLYLCNYVNGRNARMNNLWSPKVILPGLANKNSGYPVKF